MVNNSFELVAMCVKFFMVFLLVGFGEWPFPFAFKTILHALRFKNKHKNTHCKLFYSPKTRLNNFINPTGASAALFLPSHRPGRLITALCVKIRHALATTLGTCPSPMAATGSK